jgi:hypothetical protein
MFGEGILKLLSTSKKTPVDQTPQQKLKRQAERLSQQKKQEKNIAI